MEIFHITSKTYFNNQIENGHYFSPTFEQEKFIHLSFKNQVAGTLLRYFLGQNDLILLQLNHEKIERDLVIEPSTNGELFPHLYGPIVKDHILKVTELSTITSDFDSWI